jgi:hypothetical protein
MDGMDMFSDVSLTMSPCTSLPNCASVKLCDSKKWASPIFNIFTFVPCIYSLYNNNLLTVFKFLIDIGHLCLCCVPLLILEVVASWFEKKLDDTSRRLCYILNTFLLLATLYHLFLLYDYDGVFL